MAPTKGKNIINYISAFLIVGSFLFILGVNNAFPFLGTYTKLPDGTLTNLDWNNLDDDFLNRTGAASMAGTLNITNSLDVGGVIRGDTSASYISSGSFGSEYGSGGNFYFPGVLGISGNVGVGKTNPGYQLDVFGDINFSGTLRYNGDPFTSSKWNSNLSKIYFNTGNVGIGTSAPAKKLHVVGDVEVGGLVYSNTPGSGQTQALTTVDYVNAMVSGSSTSTVGFWTQNLNGIYNSSLGNVGIGTTAPGAKLAIQGTGGTGSANWGMPSDMAIRSSEMTDSSYHSILQLVSIRQSLSTGSAANGYLGFSTIDDSNGQGMLDAARIAIVNESGSTRNSATALSFWTSPGGGVGNDQSIPTTEKVRITSGGSVGIGTIAPDQKLTVTGATGGTLGLYSVAGSGNTDNRNWALLTSKWHYGDFSLIQSNAQDGNPSTTGTTRFYVDYLGNVGIGMT